MNVEMTIYLLSLYYKPSAAPHHSKGINKFVTWPISHCKGSTSAYTIQSLTHTVSQEIFIAPTIYQKRLYPGIECRSG